MYRYCSDIENEKDLAIKYHKILKKIQEWYSNMHEKYQAVFKTDMVYQLFQKEQLNGENKELIFDILNNYQNGFDTKVSIFAMIDIICRHLLSTFSYGPENDESLNFSERDIYANTNGKKIRKTWFDYDSGGIDLVEIAHYYLEKNNTCIPGVDLSVLLDERNVRSKFIHNGKFEDCVTGIRKLNCLRNILIYLDDDAAANLSEFEYPEECFCEMQDFFDHTSNLDFKESTTILVVGSMLDMNQTYLSDFLGLPWNLVMDFSGGSQNQGMRKLLNRNHVHQQSLCSTTAQHVISNLTFTPNYTEWLICGDYLTPFLKPKNSLESIIAGKDPFFEGERRTYTKYVDSIAKTICNKAKGLMRPVTIIYMYADDMIAEQLLKNCEQILFESVSYTFTGVYYWGTDKREMLFDRVFANYEDSLDDVSDRFSICSCELGSFFKGLQEYNLFSVKVTEGEQIHKEIPSISGYVELQHNLAYDLEKYFEVLYKDCGKNNADRELELQDFYRGGVAPWSAFYDGNIIDLLKPEEKDRYINRIKTSLGKIPERKADKIFHIEHTPGIGGSTLLRSIGWSLSKEYPVLLIHSYDKIGTKKVIQELYDTLKRSIVVLADEYFTYIEELEGDIKNLQRACALVVSIRDTNTSYGGYTRLPLKMISSVAEKQLKTLFKANSPLTIDEKISKENLYDTFINQDNSMRSPFMIGLFYMDKGFYGVDTYVSRVIDAVNDSRELKALGFISIADVYGQESLPKILINKYLGIPVNDNYIKSHAYTQSVLLYDRNSVSYKCKHPLISMKLLDMCSMRLYQKTFREKMLDWAIEYVDLIIDECKNSFQDIYQVVLEKVFIRNRVAAIEGVPQSDFSKYIEEVSTPEYKVEILEYLANTCKEYADMFDPEDHPQIYLMTSHFYGHLARLYGKKDSGIRNYERAMKNSQISMEYMEIGGERDSRIYHMHAKTLSDKLIFEWDNYYVDEEEIEKSIYENYEEEIRAIRSIYNNSAEYGGGDYAYPSEMELLIQYLKFVYRQKKILKREDLYKLSEVQQDFKADIETINDQLEVYEFDDNMLGAIDRLVRIYQTEIMLGDYGNAIQYYENKLQNALVNYEGPSVIERYRAGLVNSKIGKYKIRKENVWYIDPSIPAKEVADILEIIETALAQGYDEQSFQARKRRSALYNNWMIMAKYSTKPISSGISYALAWEELEKKDKQTDPRPYYYLYVLYYLSVLEGNIDNNQYLRKYQELSIKKATQVGKSINRIRDLIIEGKGMGQLMEIQRGDSDFSSIVSTNRKLKEIGGRFIDTVPGKGIIEIRKPFSWMRYRAKFEMLKHNTVGESQLTHDVSFCGGFSYEQIIAINSTVRDITAGEVNFLEDGDGLTYHDEPILIKDGVGDVWKKENSEVYSGVDSSPIVAQFFPQYPVIENNNRFYLNGKLSDNRKAGLCSVDIEQFPEKVKEKYGTAEAILHILEKFDSFNVCVINEHVDRKGAMVATVSLFATNVDLDKLMQNVPVEKTTLAPTSLVGSKIVFVPQEVQKSFPNSYLNGFLKDGMRGSVSSEDIEKYNIDDINKYGDVIGVLHELERKESFEVIVVNDDNPYRCRLSLYATGQPLSDLLDEKSEKIEEILEVEVEENSSLSTDNDFEKELILPDLDKNTELVLFDYEVKGKQISGFVRIDGYENPFPAVIPSVNPKILKSLQCKSKILTSYISKDKKQFILRIKQGM